MQTENNTPETAPEEGKETMPSLEEMLKAAELQAAEHHDAWLRAKAETENMRRRAQEDVARAHKFAVESFASELLSVKDSLEAALAADLATHGFSVDVVDMHDVTGGHHRHPGEIDLVMPVAGDPAFDGHRAGWVVFGPDSAHAPTVAGGRALVLYLLPQGAIEFTRS